MSEGPTFEIPARAREELLATGWDGTSEVHDPEPDVAQVPYVNVMPHEWPSYVVAPEVIEAAKEAMDADRRQQGSDGLFRGAAWWGDFGEIAGEEFLRSSGVAVRRFGRINAKPDLLVRGRIKVGVKTHRLSRERDLTADVQCFCPEAHVEKRPWDWWLFCQYVEETSRCVVAGALTTQGVKSRGERHEDYGGRGAAVYITPADRLLSPAAWLERITR